MKTLEALTWQMIKLRYDADEYYEEQLNYQIKENENLLQTMKELREENRLDELMELTMVELKEYKVKSELLIEENEYRNFREVE